MDRVAFPTEHLYEDELDHELSIRNATDPGTIEEKRTLLNGLLSLECDGGTMINHSICLPVVEECNKCRNKVHGVLDLVTKFSSFSLVEQQQLDTVLNSRMSYLKTRICRLPNSNSVELIKLLSITKQLHERNHESIVNQNSVNLIDFTSCDGATVDSGLNTTSPNPTSTQSSVHDNSFARLLQRVQFSNISEPVPSTSTNYPVTSTLMANNRSHNFPSNTGDNRIQISKWNITFNGRTGVNQFLERVSESAYIYNVSDDILFRQAAVFFTEDALIWYRMIKHSISSWTELVARLRQSFLPSNYELALLDEIRQRTQGPTERAEIYIAVMENLFSRLISPLDERSRVGIILKNLQPNYQRVCSLQNIDSISMLISTCKRIEDTEQNIALFKNPPIRNSTLLEPDLAYQRPIRHNISALNALTPQTTNPKRLCWNCHLPGHLYPACPKPLTIFCYGCGQSNITRPNCRRCSPLSKNVSAVSDPSASVQPAFETLTNTNGHSG